MPPESTTSTGAVVVGALRALTFTSGRIVTVVVIGPVTGLVTGRGAKVVLTVVVKRATVANTVGFAGGTTVGSRVGSRLGASNRTAIVVEIAVTIAGDIGVLVGIKTSDWRVGVGGADVGPVAVVVNSKAGRMVGNSVWEGALIAAGWATSASSLAPRSGQSSNVGGSVANQR